MPALSDAEQKQEFERRLNANLAQLAEDIRILDEEHSRRRQDATERYLREKMRIHAERDEWEAAHAATQ